MNAPYLKVTVHDNDFTSYYWQVGEAIQNIFKYEGKYPTKEDLDIIKPLIARLWWTIDNLDSYLFSYTSKEIDNSYIVSFKNGLKPISITNGDKLSEIRLLSSGSKYAVNK